MLMFQLSDIVSLKTAQVQQSKFTRTYYRNHAVRTIITNSAMCIYKFTEQ